MLDDLLLKFRDLYVMKNNICIDESMISFKGCLCFCQYVHSKRTRFEIKVWVLTESDTGYISEYSIYKANP